VVKQMQVTDETSILVEPFAPSASVPPQIALQLQALVAEAVRPLQERIAALEGSQDPGETGQDAALREEVIRLQVALQEEREGRLRAVQDLEELNDLRALEIGQDRRRIAVLEMPKDTPPTTKTLDHLDTLDREMRGSRIRQLSFAAAARILGLSHTRIQQLRPLISEDRRFTIVKDPHHKQRLLIRSNFRM